MGHPKAKVFGVLLVALAIGAYVVMPAIGAAAPSGSSTLIEGEAPGTFAPQGCEANHVCGYTKIEFEGTRIQIACSESGNFELGENIRSARNRCGNKINHLENGTNSVCMNPGGDRPNPGTFPVITLPNGFGGSC